MLICPEVCSLQRLECTTVSGTRTVFDLEELRSGIQSRSPSVRGVGEDRFLLSEMPEKQEQLSRGCRRSGTQRWRRLQDTTRGNVENSTSVQRRRNTRTPLRLESCIRREFMNYPRHRVLRLVGERRVEHLHPRDQGCRQVQLRESAERLKLQINRNSKPAQLKSC